MTSEMQFQKFKMAVAAILDFEKPLPFYYLLTDHHHHEFRKTVPISLLYYQSSPNLVGILLV